MTVCVRAMTRSEWEAAEAAHHVRVDAATAEHLRRREDGRRHPVEDFLFTYYSHRPARLRRWHPGPGVVLEGAAGLARADWRFYRADGDGVQLDLASFVESRRETVDFVAHLVSSTLDRQGQFGCFGLHEWAMVYRLEEDEVRHAGWPLRLGAAGTDAVVEAHQIRCSHYDAFRFYTPPARSLNLLQPTREAQPVLEQPGCLHAGMDLYKWAYKLAPAVPSDLVMDCFDLAREIRELDMRASPYDLSELGYEPVAIETQQGKAEYAAAQRGFSARGQELRRRLLAAVDRIRQGTSRHPATGGTREVSDQPGRQRTGTPALTRP